MAEQVKGDAERAAEGAPSVTSTLVGDNLPGLQIFVPGRVLAW